MKNKKLLVLSIIMILLVGVFATTAFATTNSNDGGFWSWLASFFGISSGDAMTGKVTYDTTDEYNSCCYEGGCYVAPAIGEQDCINVGEPSSGDNCEGTSCNPIIGCTDASACNYNPDANEDDGSCLFPGEVCDGLGNVYDSDCICPVTGACCFEDTLAPVSYDAAQSITCADGVTEETCNALGESITNILKFHEGLTCADNPCVDCEITCPTDSVQTTVQLDNNCVADFSSLPQPTTNGFCGEITYTDAPPIYICDGSDGNQEGSYTFERTVNTEAGPSCNMDVTASDVTAPTANSPASGIYYALDDLLLAMNADDNCDSELDLSFSEASPVITSYNAASTYDLTVTDDCGNAYTVNGASNIEACWGDYDTEAPVCTTWPDIVTDNCGPTICNEVPTITSYGAQEIIQRTFECSDPTGNTVTCVVDYDTCEGDNNPPIADFDLEYDVACQDYDANSLYGFSATDQEGNGVNIAWSDAGLSGGCVQPTNKYIRTYTVSDNCNNEVKFDQYINLRDDEAPVWNGDCSSVEDNCDASLTIDGYTATDDCDNSAFCPNAGCCCVNGVPSGEYVYGYDDAFCFDELGGTFIQGQSCDSDPCDTIACPADITVECDDISNTGTATCLTAGQVPEYEDVIVPGTCPNQYTIERTWTCVDDVIAPTSYNAQGLTSCVQTINVEDTTPPQFYDIEYNIYNGETISAECDDVPGLIQMEVDDNCGTHTDFWEEFESGDSCDLTITRTLTATDECGNSNTFTYYVAVQDTIAPEIGTVNLPTYSDIAEIEQIVSDINDGIGNWVIGSDNCNDVTYSATYVDNGDGTATIYITVTDACEHSTTLDYLVILTDPITCPADITVECNNPKDPSYTGYPTIPAGFELKEPSDIIIAGSCDNEYEILRTWTMVEQIYDPTGFSTQDVLSCVQKIYVEDTTPPEVTFSATTRNVACGESLDPSIVGGLPEFEDNCQGELNIIWQDSTTEPECATSFTRTWTATDVCGNSANEYQTINLVDTTPPTVVSCPEAIVLEATGSTTYVDWTVEVIDDYSSAEIYCSPGEEIITSASVESSASFYNEFLVGDTVVVCEIIAGGGDECAFTVTITDTTEPVVICPEDLTIEFNEQCAFNLNYEVYAHDSITPDEQLGVSSFFLSESNVCEPLFSGSGYDAMISQENNFMCTTSGSAITPIEVNVVVVDGAENENSCGFTINALDTIPPVITCPADLTITEDDSTHPDYTGQADATDNCVVSVTYSDEKTGVEAPYEITRIWRASDFFGNSDTCIQTITVEDIVEPVAFCIEPTAFEFTYPEKLKENVYIKLEVMSFDNCQNIYGIFEEFTTEFYNYNWNIGEPICTKEAFVLDNDEDGDYLELFDLKLKVTIDSGDECYNSGTWLFDMGPYQSVEYDECADDTENPTVIPRNELFVEIGQNGMIKIYAEDFDLASYDNCDEELTFSFSEDADDTSKVFYCNGVGRSYAIKLWATDDKGNQAFADTDTFVIIEDNQGFCVEP